MEELLRIRDLSTVSTYESSLNNFRLQVFSQEILGIIGLNGSGKSTLPAVLSGDTGVKRGVIEFNGVRWDLGSQKVSRSQFEEQGLFVIKNETRLIQNLNIADNMFLSLKRRVRDFLKNPGSKEKLVELTLDEFFPDLNPTTDASELSLPEHWKIGVLKAYLEGAVLIILDRILEFCSEKERTDLITFIGLLRTKGTTFVLTYNKVSPFFHVFDRIAIVRGGGISGILHRGDYDPKLLAHLVIGREYADTFSLNKENEAGPGGKLLEIRNFIPENGNEKISLILHKGEILGIYDPLQEKSAAVINLLNGSMASEKDCVLIGEKHQSITEEHHTVRAGIGIVSEKFFDRLFFRDLSAGQNLVVSAAKKSSQFWGHIPSAAEKYLESVYPLEIGIPEEYSKIPVKLIEKDLQFILALHMRILSGAKIFVLENPVRGADLLTRKMVYRKIDFLRKKGTGVIFISTDITELEGFCDRIIQFDKVGSV